jgi:hypothetical protein
MNLGLCFQGWPLPFGANEAGTGSGEDSGLKLRPPPHRLQNLLHLSPALPPGPVLQLLRPRLLWLHPSDIPWCGKCS